MATSTLLPAGSANETRLVFIGSNGKPIPANWNFGTDGDGRFYPLAQEIRTLGGYWETIVYLSPNDTYSLVGASPPPTGTKGARKRARESSSVYPEISAGSSAERRVARGAGAQRPRQLLQSAERRSKRVRQFGLL